MPIMNASIAVTAESVPRALSSDVTVTVDVTGTVRVRATGLAGRGIARVPLCTWHAHWH